MNRISAWLDSHPLNPEGYDCDDHYRQRQPKRRCLGAMSPREGLRRSPRKHASAPITPPLRPLSDENEQTPKAIVPVLDSAVLPPPSPTRSSISWSSTDSRPRSPVRRMGDLMLANGRMHIAALSAPGSRTGCSAPDSVKPLCRDLNRLNTSRCVIPHELLPRATALIDEGYLDEMNFGDASDPVEADSWARIHEIIDAATECQDAGLPEAAWNSEVHSRVLRFALDPYRRTTGVWYRDITTARIRDPELLPRFEGGGIGQSKMVDYALILEDCNDEDYALYEGSCSDGTPSKRRRFGDRVAETLRRKGGASINQTRMDHVRYTPFAVSIETKRAAGEDEAHVQLAVWVWAQFARLRQLAPAAKSWPVLPLVAVQGHEWRLLFAEVVDSGCAIRILQYVVLRATDIVLRAYQLVASLRRLARWVKDE